MRDRRTITISVDGQARTSRPGTSVAAAIMNAGTLALRRSVSGEGRGALCGIGHCHECRVTINGRPNVRACLVACRDGMDVRLDGVGALGPRPLAAPLDGPLRDHPRVVEADGAIVGAGPAGLVAVQAFTSHAPRARVLLIDDQPTTGGQIWRGDDHRRRRADAMLRKRNVTHLHSCAIVQPLGPGELLAYAGDEAAGAEAVLIRAPKLVLATGARELFLPFPGWTLPGVLGAGGIQALVKSGLDIRGKRVLVAGSGPLLIQVAAFLARRGARVLGVAEQAEPDAVNRFARGLWRWPGKAAQAAWLRAGLLASGVPYWTGTWATQALGDGRVERVRLAGESGEEREVSCDLLACAFGLVPNTQLAALLGCQIDGGAVHVDAHQATCIPGVFAAGEACGIGGVDVAQEEGRIAGANAAGANPAFRSNPRTRLFARQLASAFALRPEVRRLARADTTLCRCEDVSFDATRACASWREAKLQARCGMGACQGRTCGPASAATLGLIPTDARPPLSPVPLGLLAAIPGDEP
ncbi:MAG: FAD-dependent oxidoreductase [Phycisphaerales bacterium]